MPVAQSSSGRDRDQFVKRLPQRPQEGTCRRSRGLRIGGIAQPVSYTHLTLPTSDLV